MYLDCRTGQTFRLRVEHKTKKLFVLCQPADDPVHCGWPLLGPPPGMPLSQIALGYYQSYDEAYRAAQRENCPYQSPIYHQRQYVKIS